MRTRTQIFLGTLAALVSGLAAAQPAEAPVHQPVFYPAGSCTTGWLEIQVWSREGEADAWAPHPEHPRAQADRCHEERVDRLLNELRVRCIDPEGERTPSDWVVGAQVLEPRPSALCETGR